MKSFKQVIEEQHKEVLAEAIRYKDFPRATQLIRKYMTKHLGNTYFYPTPETFSVGGSPKVGIRFFTQKKRSFRLNWVRGKLGSSVGIVSADIWDGTKSPQPTPTTHIEFAHDQSLATVLPFIKDYMLGKFKTTEGVYISDGVDEQALREDLDFNLLIEGRTVPASVVAKTVNNMIKAFSQGIQIQQQHLNGGNKKYGPLWHVAKRVVKELYPSLFNTIPGSGTREKAILKSDVKKLDAKKILAAIMGNDGVAEFKATKGKTEKVDVPGASTEDIERLTYEEQLEALKTGMKLLMQNATNALFVAGRGGTGKTQTVEDMLHAAGKAEDEGYYKVTGSATPVGAYRILHQYRNEIMLFDDSDVVLQDQEGRNIFKAASDTKKIRRISWLKGGKNFVDAENFNEDEDDDKLPRTFEFKGKIIFISNLHINKLDPDGALRTRGYVINVDPTNEEIYDFMEKIVDKIELSVNYKLSHAKRMEVVDVLRSRPLAEKEANLRSLVRGLNTRAAIEAEGGKSAEWLTFVKNYA